MTTWRVYLPTLAVRAWSSRTHKIILHNIVRAGLFSPYKYNGTVLVATWYWRTTANAFENKTFINRTEVVWRGGCGRAAGQQPRCTSVDIRSHRLPGIQVRTEHSPFTIWTRSHQNGEFTLVHFYCQLLDVNHERVHGVPEPVICCCARILFGSRCSQPIVRIGRMYS